MTKDLVRNNFPKAKRYRRSFERRLIDSNVTVFRLQTEESHRKGEVLPEWGYYHLHGDNVRPQNDLVKIAMRRRKQETYSGPDPKGR